MITKDKRFVALIYAFAFFSLFIVFYLTPHNVDDVTYDYLNLAKPSEIFNYCAGYGNGRILGNLCACLLCKSRLVAALIRALFVTFIPLLCSKLVLNNRQTIAYELALLLTIGTDAFMFGNTFAWISAFSNYVPPVLFTLLCLLLIKNYEVGVKVNYIKLPIVFVLGVCTQLFAENVTLYTIILSVAIIAFCFKNGKSRLVSTVYFISAATGAVIMLYSRLNLHSELRPYNISKYQSFSSSLSSLADIMPKSVAEITKGISHNFILFFAVSVLLLCLMKNKTNSVSLPKQMIFFQKSILVFFPFFWLFKRFYYQPEHLLIMKLADNFFCLLTLVVYLICVITVIYFFDDKTAKRKHLILLGFSVITIMPLAVVSPISERVLFYTYTVLILFCLSLANTVMRELDVSRVRAFKEISSSAIIAICCFLCLTYINNYTLYSAAFEYAEYQINSGKETVTLYEADKSGYFSVHQFNELFKAKLGDNIEYNYVSINEWLENYYKNGNYKE